MESKNWKVDEIQTLIVAMDQGVNEKVYKLTAVKFTSMERNPEKRLKLHQGYRGMKEYNSRSKSDRKTGTRIVGVTCSSTGFEQDSQSRGCCYCQHLANSMKQQQKRVR